MLRLSLQILGAPDHRDGRPLKMPRATPRPLCFGHVGCQCKDKVMESTSVPRNEHTIEYLPVLTKIPRMPAFCAPPTSSLQSCNRTGDYLWSDA